MIILEFFDYPSGKRIGEWPTEGAVPRVDDVVNLQVKLMPWHRRVRSLDWCFGTRGLERVKVLVYKE